MDRKALTIPKSGNTSERGETSHASQASPILLKFWTKQHSFGPPKKKVGREARGAGRSALLDAVSFPENKKRGHQLLKT